MPVSDSIVRTIALASIAAASLCAVGATRPPHQPASDATPSTPASAQTPYGPHLWDTPLTPDIFQKRIDEQLALAQKSFDQMLAVDGPRTVQNTLAPFDEATLHLDAAGMQAGAMQNVSPDAKIRDRAQQMIQKISNIATAVSLNPKIYNALAAVNATDSDAATKYYLQRTLLEFRLAGVDRDDATRARIQSLNDEITKISTDFERNIQDSQIKIVVKNAA